MPTTRHFICTGNLGNYRTSHPEVWDTEDVEYYLTHTPQTKPFQDVLRPEQVEKFSYSTGMDKTAEIQTPERPYSHSQHWINTKLGQAWLRSRRYA